MHEMVMTRNEDLAVPDGPLLQCQHSMGPNAVTSCNESATVLAVISFLPGFMIYLFCSLKRLRAKYSQLIKCKSVLFAMAEDMLTEVVSSDFH